MRAVHNQPNQTKMPTQKKNSKSGKKTQVKMKDLKPRKDAKGGITHWSKKNDN
jgi:hypothetical protein